MTTLYDFYYLGGKANSTIDDAICYTAQNTTKWHHFVLSLAIFLGFVIYTYTYVSDRMARRNTKHPILGDTSWWGRRAWFLSLSTVDMVSLVLAGYNQHSQADRTWCTWVFDTLIHVLPMSMIDDLKSLPPEKASFMGLVDTMFMWETHTGTTLKGRDHITALKRYLIPNLPNMTDEISQEVELVLSRLFGTGPQSHRGWTTDILWNSTTQVSYNLVCSLLIDGDLGRSEDFVDHASAYTKTIPIWGALKFTLPPFLQGLSSSFMPPAWEIRRHRTKVERLVIPEIQRRRLVFSGQTAKPKDILQALIDTSQDLNRNTSDEEIVHQLLFILFAAADLLAIVLTQLVHRTIAHPEYQEELKQEVELALAQSSGWNKLALSRMVKLDSFLREVLRLSPPILTTVQRKFFQDVTLSNGTVFKAGDCVMFPTRAVLSDPSIYPDPYKFDPYRFLSSDRTKNESLAAMQTKDYMVYAKQLGYTAFVASANDITSFGYGQQACPGRFYGIMASKLVLAKLLVDYDMKFVPERKSAPVDASMGVQLAPNMDTCVAFRRKTKAKSVAGTWKSDVGSV